MKNQYFCSMRSSVHSKIKFASRVSLSFPCIEDLLSNHCVCLECIPKNRRKLNDLFSWLISFYLIRVSLILISILVHLFIFHLLFYSFSFFFFFSVPHACYYQWRFYLNRNCPFLSQSSSWQMSQIYPRTKSHKLQKSRNTAPTEFLKTTGVKASRNWSDQYLDLQKVIMLNLWILTTFNFLKQVVAESSPFAA